MSTGSSGSALDHEVASHHCSTVGTSGSRKSSKSMALLNSAIKHATHSFIGILDMFGFEDSKPSQLEQLCINLCSETMQHFYNTHIFKASIESCREEGITSDVSIEYFDNVPCIDLISSLVCIIIVSNIVFENHQKMSYLNQFQKFPVKKVRKVAALN